MGALIVLAQQIQSSTIPVYAYYSYHPKGRNMSLLCRAIMLIMKIYSVVSSCTRRLNTIRHTSQMTLEKSVFFDLAELLYEPNSSYRVNHAIYLITYQSTTS